MTTAVPFAFSGTKIVTVGVFFSTAPTEAGAAPSQSRTSCGFAGSAPRDSDIISGAISMKWLRSDIIGRVRREAVFCLLPFYFCLEFFQWGRTGIDRVN